jgi:hypothetical protein
MACAQRLQEWLMWGGEACGRRRCYDPHLIGMCSPSKCMFLVVWLMMCSALCCCSWMRPLLRAPDARRTSESNGKREVKDGPVAMVRATSGTCIPSNC